MTQLATVTAGAGADTVVNQNLRAVAPAGLYGIRQAATSGLVLGYFGGAFNGVDVADGAVTLTASATNYVVANRTTGVVSAATSTTNWVDTTNYMQLYQLVAAASTFTIAATSDRRQSFGGTAGSGGTFTGGTLASALNEAPQVTIASATAPSATAIGAAASNTVIISGTTTITGFDAIAAGAVRRLRFTGILTLTHNGTSLILPAATNIVTAAGDVATMESLGSGNWRCIDYARADGTALVSGGGGGSGTVTSISASGGVETTSGSAITATGTIQAATLVNPQTGTSYAYVTGDRGRLVTHSNAAAVAGTLPQATSTFGSGWFMWVKNKGAGTLTITPTTSTIDGAATLVLTTGQWALITSDGANYQANVYAPAGGGGSLTNFTESVNTASPNGTVPVVRLIATNAATNVDVALAPKGSGSLLSAIPDSTSAGGNKRGTYAVDWQMVRSGADNVASGSYSSIVGGAFGKASNTGATVLGGEGNLASGQHAVAGGKSSTASGDRSVAIGESVTASNLNSTSFGLSNTSSGGYSFTAGSTNTASASYCVAFGNNCKADGQGSFAAGIWADSRTTAGVRVWSAGRFAAAGDAQIREGVMRISSTDATSVELTTNGAAASGGVNRLVLPNNSAGYMSGRIVARDSSGNVASWDFKLLAKNTGGTLSIVGQSFVSAFADAGATSWTAAASVGSPGIIFSVTGAASTSIKWVSSFESLEVVG